MQYTDVYGDFQCDLTEGYPTLLYVNFDNNTLFIGLNENLSGTEEERKSYQKLCDEFGVKSFADVYDLIYKIKYYFGDEAYENCAYTIAREFDIELK